GPAGSACRHRAATARCASTDRSLRARSLPSGVSFSPPSRRAGQTVFVQLLATGRDADVFDAGPGRVLRRYRNPDRSSVREAEIMRYARDQGFPVPAVFDADGPDLVMERVVGPTMTRLLL